MGLGFLGPFQITSLIRFPNRDRRRAAHNRWPRPPTLAACSARLAALAVGGLEEGFKGRHLSFTRTVRNGFLFDTGQARFLPLRRSKSNQAQYGSLVYLCNGLVVDDRGIGLAMVVDWQVARQPAEVSQYLCLLATAFSHPV